MIDRTAFTAADIVAEIWRYLELPPEALSSLSLPGSSSSYKEDKPAVHSSFKIGLLAQSSVALSALSAALVHAIRVDSIRTDSGPDDGLGESGEEDFSVPRVTVPLRHAVLEFLCERLYTLAGNPPEETWGPIGGLYPTAEEGGYVRVHDVFPHHRRGVLKLLGLEGDCVERNAVAERIRTRGWRSEELERVAVEEMGLAVYKLRSFDEWDGLSRAGAMRDFPVSVRRVGIESTESKSSEREKGMKGGKEGRRSTKSKIGSENQNENKTRGRASTSTLKKCLSGLRVLERSRVIAAPVAGKTLAAHGADVLWITCPRLPDLPGLDREFARGKKSVSLDLDIPGDKQTFLDLARDADIVIQGYRPGSLAARGIDIETLGKINPGVVVANLSAFGPEGEWKDRRGFDSLVQTATGINVSEAEHHGGGAGEVARPLPCQALDHGAGFLLAAGVCAAVYHRERDRRREGRGGSGSVSAYVVDVSLAGVGKYLRSLGQYEGRSGFEGRDLTALGPRSERSEEEEGFFETRQTAFGEMTFLRHSASVDGFETGWDSMPVPLGLSQPAWS